jgi:manganese transport protein
MWPLLGPAFVAAVAYVDPGNFATNVSGGALFGYTLLWAIVAANLMAMLIRSLTAKLGLATGRDLATLCRERLPRPVTRGLWLQAEAVAIATDLAEVVGGAVALYLLFGLPMPIGGAITAVVAFVLLAAQSRGHRPFERVIAGLLLVVGLGSHLTVPALLLSLLHVTAIGVALAHPGQPTVAGLVVLAGITAHWALRHRLRSVARLPVGAEIAVAPASAVA